MSVKSVNLSERNEKIYAKHFKGYYGKFSQWMNDQLNKEFLLDGEEAIRHKIKENSKDIQRLETDQEKLIKKLRVTIDRTNEEMQL